MDLGLQTIETVARRFHPQVDDPLWRFTVPEALTLVERVSRELRPFVVDNIPLGDQLTIAQVIKIYRWRSVVDVAEKAYDLWRIIRLLNPVAAITNEARERLTKKLYTGVRDELARRLMQGYVREVGRAAIDLYGGRLRVSTEQIVHHVSEATERDGAAPDIAEPLRLLVAGQVGAGKSSLDQCVVARGPFRGRCKADDRGVHALRAETRDAATRSADRQSRDPVRCGQHRSPVW